MLNNILELNEAQGLTLQLVEEWMNRAGWRKISVEMHADSKRTGIYQNKLLSPKNGWAMLMPCGLHSGLFEDLLRHSDHDSIQALLREINPRLRRGMPSLAAWEANGGKDGLWIAVWDITKEGAGDFGWFAQRPIITNLRRYDDTWDWGIRGTGFFQCDGEPKETTWLFWPCDIHGNKIPWPTDSNGNML